MVAIASTYTVDRDSSDTAANIILARTIVLHFIETGDSNSMPKKGKNPAQPIQANGRYLPSKMTNSQLQTPEPRDIDELITPISQ